MPDYKSLYFELFNKLTDVIEELKDIQVKMEEKYIEENDNKENMWKCEKDDFDTQNHLFYSLYFPTNQPIYPPFPVVQLLFFLGIFLLFQYSRVPSNLPGN